MIRFKSLLLMLSLGYLATTAQVADKKNAVDFTPWDKPDYSLVSKAQNAKSKSVGAVRPDHVDNGKTIYFTPVFNQDNGSCGSAALIAYQMAHELNAYRGTDGSLEHNMLPTHFTWLLTYGNSSKEEMAKANGVPPVDVYGGRTYSRQLGSYDWDSPDAGWMQGYDKWYAAMSNRIQDFVSLPYDLGTEEGRELFKNWLWNHCGDTSFKAGGLGHIGVASGGVWEKIPSTTVNKEIGVAGMQYVKQWGKSVDHALTIVGYDDRIEFDLNGNGVYGEADADEVGAWIIVNSWDKWWCNEGFIYCPYAYSGPYFTADDKFCGSYWSPGLIYIRKDYTPQRTIKIKMDYSRRSEVYLTAGVSSDLNATEPEVGCAFEHFKYAGDGHNGDSIPAPEVPMLGRWADGKLHDEPMEFGYDLTDITNRLDPAMPLKYFFTVTTRDGALGEGHIREASIMDYVISPDGQATPFDITAPDGVKIEKGGGKTYITVIVNGRGSQSPRNARIADGVLTWDEPARSGMTLTGYRIYSGDEIIGEQGVDSRSFTLPDETVATYAVTALYDKVESQRITAEVLGGETVYTALNLKKNGLTLPDVFGTHYDCATIEYWINCTTLLNWNQSAGPGWGTFYLHANSDGSYTVGWDISSRSSASSALSVGKWVHVAVVVENNKMTTYINGVKKKEFTSEKYSGLGGFGDFVFKYSNGTNTHTNAKLKDIRIWKTARTAEEIAANYKSEYGNAGVPEDLIAYYKGDLISDGGVMKLRDYARYHRHGIFATDDYVKITASVAGFKASTDLAVDIIEPEGEIFAGIPTKFTATTGAGVKSLEWFVDKMDGDTLSCLSPSITFPNTGTYKVVAKALDKSGESVSDTLSVEVSPCPEPDASFELSSSTVPAGDPVSFRVTNAKLGYIYNWQMPGAVVEQANTTDAAATYTDQGTYDVTLTVTAPDGRTDKKSCKVTVSATAPVAAYVVSPTLVVKGETVYLTDKSKYEPTKWDWTLFNGNHAEKGNTQYCKFNPTRPGIYDLTFTAANSEGESTVTEKNALIVCNADSKNGLLFTSDANSVSLTTVPFKQFQRNFTIDWWMRPTTLANNTLGIGDKASTMMLSATSTGAMKISMKAKSTTTPAGYIIAGEWHHYAMTFSTGIIKLYRDGQLFASTSVTGATSLPAISQYAIGLENAPMRGQIDEFRIWNKTLTEDQIKSYCNKPIEAENLATAEAEGLVLYYDFNQSGGDVIDRSSSGNTGVRTGFGPDGDAWGLSRGVFAIDVDSDVTDVTSQYLKNYTTPFENTGRKYNPSGGTRFMELKDWTRENEGETSQPTGAHVDANKSSNFTITTNWDGFASSISNHKVYQSITLPQGFYIFEANYGPNEGQAGGSYIVAAEGVGLPDENDLKTGSLGYTQIRDKSDDNMSTTVSFYVDSEKTVSLGLLVNMSGSTCATFQSFALRKGSLSEMENDPTGLEDVQTDKAVKGDKIYNLNGVNVDQMDNKGIYIKNGRKVYKH